MEHAAHELWHELLEILRHAGPAIGAAIGIAVAGLLVHKRRKP